MLKVVVADSLVSDSDVLFPNDFVADVFVAKVHDVFVAEVEVLCR